MVNACAAARLTSADFLKSLDLIETYLKQSFSRTLRKYLRLAPPFEEDSSLVCK